MKGKLVVIEGIDGAGTETQSKLILEYLKSKNIPCVRISYPNYERAIGKFIHDFLQGKHTLDVETQFILYSCDMVNDRDKINGWLKRGKTVIADRYFTSALAYQCMQGFPVDKALRFAELFELPRPDNIIFLKISVKTSAKRKGKEKTHLDRNESNEKFLKEVSDFYERLIKDNVFGKWKIIDGKKNRDAVLKDIIKALNL